MSRFTLIFITLLVAGGRFCIPGHGMSWPGTYEAMSHIWVGLLLAPLVWRFQDPNRRISIDLLIAISFLETVMFLLR